MNIGEPNFCNFDIYIISVKALFFQFAHWIGPHIVFLSFQSTFSFHVSDGDDDDGIDDDDDDDYHLVGLLGPSLVLSWSLPPAEDR